jgi:hypothetical protein
MAFSRLPLKVFSKRKTTRILKKKLSVKFPSLNVRPVSEEIKATIERRLHEELGGAGLDQCCCVVCDELVLCKESTPILWEQGNEEITKLRDAMKDCLYPPEDEADSIPKDLIQYYSLSPDLDLEGCLLSRSGVYIEKSDNHRTFLRFCKKCLKSLQTPVKEGNKRKPPEFAIANHFFYRFSSR